MVGAVRIDIYPAHPPLDQCGEQAIDHPDDKHDPPETDHGPTGNRVTTVPHQTCLRDHLPEMIVVFGYPGPVHLKHVISHDLPMIRRILTEVRTAFWKNASSGTIV